MKSKTCVCILLIKLCSTLLISHQNNVSQASALDRKCLISHLRLNGDPLFLVELRLNSLCIADKLWGEAARMTEDFFFSSTSAESVTLSFVLRNATRSKSSLGCIISPCHCLEFCKSLQSQSCTKWNMLLKKTKTGAQNESQ